MAFDLTLVPSNVGPFDEANVNKAIDAVRHDPAKAQQIADALLSNPRQAVQHMFALSASQQQTLSTLSDQELKQLVLPVAQTLKGPHLGTAHLTFKPLSPLPANTAAPVIQPFLKIHKIIDIQT